MFVTWLYRLELSAVSCDCDWSWNILLFDTGAHLYICPVLWTLAAVSIIIVLFVSVSWCVHAFLLCVQSWCHQTRSTLRNRSSISCLQVSLCPFIRSVCLPVIVTLSREVHLDKNMGLEFTKTESVWRYSGGFGPTDKTLCEWYMKFQQSGCLCAVKWTGWRAIGRDSQGALRIKHIVRAGNADAG
jgi:hypothetical protein